MSFSSLLSVYQNLSSHLGHGKRRNLHDPCLNLTLELRLMNFVLETKNQTNEFIEKFCQKSEIIAVNAD
jgi:hypothetical protein